MAKSNVKSKIMPTVVLSAICVTVALLLSVINIFTAPEIARVQREKEAAALRQVYPNGKEFVEIDLATMAKKPDGLSAAYKADDGGYVFKMVVSGYKDGLTIMCGVDSEGKITDSKCIASSETNGAEAVLNGKYNGATLDSLKTETVAGSTLTSDAYSLAMKSALQSYALLIGQDVDLRSPQQIINDNCNALLGTEGLSFEKWFAINEITADAIYSNKDAKGTVVIIGETYVKIDENGVASGEGIDEETKAAAEASYATYATSTYNEIALPEGTPAEVKKIYLTNEGNYIFDLEAKGYGITNKYGSGKPIVIKLAVTADGKIISTLTVSHGESKNYGDKCALPSFYEQFNGTTSENYNDVEKISGATYTTKAYKKAVGSAFTTLDLLKGGSEE